MARIRFIPAAEASGELATCYDQMRDPGGRVANILSVHSLNPVALAAHYELYRVVMYGPSELSRAEREMVAVVVSATNHCHY